MYSPLERLYNLYIYRNIVSILSWYSVVGAPIGEFPLPIAERFRAGLIDLLWRIMHFPLPTVAALNGKLFVNCVF
jgi:hypothetical protein